MMKDKPPKKSATQGLNKLIEKLAHVNADVVLSKRKIIYLAAILIALPISYSINNLKIDNEMIGYFDEESIIYRDNEIIKQYFAGAATVEFTLSSKQVDFFKNAENIRILERIEQQLQSHKHVHATYGLPSFLKLINKASAHHSTTACLTPIQS